MQITIDIPESLIRKSVDMVLQATFIGMSFRPHAEVGEEIARQVDEWAKQQDYGPLIREMAPHIVRQVTEDLLRVAIKTEIRRQMKKLKMSSLVELPLEELEGTEENYGLLHAK